MESIIKHIRKRRAGLTFYRTGRIDIASSVSKELKLQDGCSIDILQDGGEYYLRKTPMQRFVRPSLKCMRARSTGNCYRTYSVELCKCMYDIAKVITDIDKFALPTGAPINNNEYGILIPIITRLVL